MSYARRAHELRALRSEGELVHVAIAGQDGRLTARYLPIAEYGLIGGGHTVALVDTDGTIDRSCCPRFDSPSVFPPTLDAPHPTHFP